MGNVVLKNITKIYDKKTKVLDNISLEIQDKDFVVIMGPSGCGKTTLLKIIAGLQDCDSGEIIIENKCVNDFSPKNRDVAMVFQNYILYPHFSVRQNLDFPLKIKGFRKKDREALIESTAKLLEIDNILDKKPNELSGGQKQRVAIGKSIVRNPKVFLFDEPLSNLDIKLKHQLRLELLSLYKKLQITSVYVTHDYIEAMTMATKIAVMNDGKILQYSTPHQIYNNPINRFVADFIGFPNINMIKVVIENNQDSYKVIIDKNHFLLLEKHNFSYIDRYIGKELFLGIRPEHFELGKEYKNQITGKVKLIDYLGYETHVYLDVFGKDIVFKLFDDTEFFLNSDISINPKLNKIMFFDIESELRIF